MATNSEANMQSYAPVPPIFSKLGLAHASPFAFLLIRFAIALAGLVVLHVAAALKHQLIDRDGLLTRMLPRGRA